MIHPDLYSLSFVTPEFVVTKINLTWKEIYWAYQHRLFGSMMFAKIAQLRHEHSDLVNELSKIDKDHLWRAEEIVIELIKLEDEVPEDVIIKKWLFVILSYIYEHREQFVDPFLQIEEVYETFGSPSELDSFIPYRPANLNIYDPSKHSYQENVTRLYANLLEYLEAQQRNFANTTKNNGE